MADIIEFMPGDELMSALQGVLENVRPDRVQDLDNQVITDRDWREEVLVYALSEALKELGDRILYHDGSDDQRAVVGEERLTTDLVFRSWTFSQRPIDRLRLLGLIRWYLPGSGFDKSAGRHIAELLVWRLWQLLSSDTSVHLNGVLLCLKGDRVEVKMLVSTTS